MLISLADVAIDVASLLVSVQYADTCVLCKETFSISVFIIPSWVSFRC